MLVLGANVRAMLPSKPATTSPSAGAVLTSMGRTRVVKLDVNAWSSGTPSAELVLASSVIVNVVAGGRGSGITQSSLVASALQLSSPQVAFGSKYRASSALARSIALLNVNESVGVISTPLVPSFGERYTTGGCSESGRGSMPVVNANSYG